MSLTPNSALGATVPTLVGGDASGLPVPGIREGSSGPIHIVPSPQLGDLSQFVSLGGSPGTPPLPPTVRQGIAGSIPQSVPLTSQGEGGLQSSSSNPNLILNNSSEATSNRSAPVSAPCGACKFLRRKCTSTCVFASHFQPDQSTRFANVHKIFGASNVAKWLQELPAHSRDDAVNSLCYEADARIKDPVYGCVGALFALQQQVVRLQAESAAAQAELARLRAIAAGQVANAGVTFPPGNVVDHLHSRFPPPPQLAMLPSFVPGMMNNVGAFDPGVQGSAISLPMYSGSHLKAGPAFGVNLLSGTTSSATHMPLYSMTSASQCFSSPTLPGQGSMSAPPPLKLSPQNVRLHGVPSTGSTNDHCPTAESPSGPSMYGSTRCKRLKSEQGSSSSLLDVSPPACSRSQNFAENMLILGPQGYPLLDPVHAGSFPKHEFSVPLPQQGQDTAQIVMVPQAQQRSLPSVISRQ